MPHLAKWKIALVMILGLLTVGLGVGLVIHSYLARPTPSSEVAAVPAPPDPEKPEPELLPPPNTEVEKPILRVDASGDPLPKGVVQRLGTTRWRMTDALQCLTCSADGRRLATVCLGPEGLIQVWDTDTGKESRKLRMDRVSRIALSADGKILAASLDPDAKGVEKIVLWSDGNGQPSRTFEVTDILYSLLLDGNRLWVGGHDALYCWDIEKDFQTVVEKFAKPQSVVRLAVSPAAPGLVAVGMTSGIGLYDEKDRELDMSRFTKTEEIDTLAFAPDGKSLSTSSAGGKLTIWDVTERRLKERATIPGQGGRIVSHGYSTDSRELISVNERGRYQRANAQTGVSLASARLEKRGKARIIPGVFSRGLVVSGDGRRILGQLELEVKEISHTIASWDVADGKEILPLFGHESAVVKLMFQDDGSLLSLAEDGDVIRWDLKGKERQRQQFPWDQVKRASLTDDGRLITTLDDVHAQPAKSGTEEYSRIGVHDTSTHELLREFREKGLTNVWAAFSPDRSLLLLARRNSLSFHDPNANTVEEVSTPLPRLDGLVFSSDSRRVALVNESGTQIWSLANRKILCTLDKITCAGPLAFSLDGKRVAVYSGDKIITLADAESGSRQGEIKVDATDISALVFGPLPFHLTVAANNGIHLLDLRTKQTVMLLNGAQGGVRSLAYSFDQGVLASGGADSTVLLWDVFVEKSPAPKAPAELWNDLASTDAFRATAALRSLSSGGESTLTLLRERLLTPDKPFGSEAQRRLIAQLAHSDYKVRAEAFAEAKKNPGTAEPVLREEYRNTKDEIFRLRLRTFLNELESEDLLVPQDERLRERRIVFLLETMESPAARQLLTTLARDATSESLRAAAEAALARRP